MRRFDQTAQLIHRNQCNVVAATPMNDHWLSTVGGLVHESFQIRPGLRVSGFCRHADLYRSTVQIIPAACKPRASRVRLPSAAATSTRVSPQKRAPRHGAPAPCPPSCTVLTDAKLLVLTSPIRR